MPSKLQKCPPHNFSRLTSPGPGYRKQIGTKKKKVKEQVCYQYTSDGRPKYKDVDRVREEAIYSKSRFVKVFCRSCGETKEIEERPVTATTHN